MPKADASIEIIDARENNLKNISCKIPLNSIVCINGVSGSGKTTLANKLLAQEAARRRKIQSGSKNRYYHLVRGDFLSIKNLPEVILVDQKPLLQSESSTVATASGLNDFIRSSFVKHGVIHCVCGVVVEELPSYQTIKKVVARAILDGEYNIFFNVPAKYLSRTEKFIEFMEAGGFKKFQLKGNKKNYGVGDFKKLGLDSSSKILIEAGSLDQLESLGISTACIYLSRGTEIVLDFSHQTFCQSCMTEYQQKALSLFTKSKLSERSGCCSACDGKGTISSLNEKLLFFPKKNLADGFLKLEHDGEKYIPINLYKSKLKKIIQDGKGKLASVYEDFSAQIKSNIRKVIFDKLIALQGSAAYSELVTSSVCENCGGSGFSPAAQAVKLNGSSIADVLNLPMGDAFSAMRDPEFSVILSAAQDLSLGHLVLSRSTATLSGGELQRIKLIEAIAARVTGRLIIIDEPSAGLSSSDVNKLFVLLEKLKAEGNTVLLIDHSDLVVSQSDFSLHLGPGSSLAGGYLLSTVDHILPNFSPKKKVAKCFDDFVFLSKINFNNVVEQDVSFPKGAVTAIVGDSGSGKSSLVQGIALRTVSTVIDVKTNNCLSTVMLGQKQIRGNKRSSLSTFLGLSDILRKLYSETVVAQALNLDASFFTYNGANGACSECQGAGEISGETCKSCGGRRFNSLALSAMLHNYNISEILGLAATEIIQLELHPTISRVCTLLVSLGLGHLNLGRNLTDLSGGESQRVKLAKFLDENARLASSNDFGLLVILDEPCKGLSKKDCQFVLDVIQGLAKDGHSVLVIEHNEALIQQVDFVIKMGPGVGDKGGKIVFSGPVSSYQPSHLRRRGVKPTAISHYRDSSPCLSSEDRYFEKITSYLGGASVFQAGGKYFKTKSELFEYLEDTHIESPYYFNPFCSELYAYGRISRTQIKRRLESLAKLGLTKVRIKNELVKLAGAARYVNADSIWEFQVETDSPELAYNLGSGWLAIKNGEGLEVLSTRLVDFGNKIIGERSLTRKTFSSYYNGCRLCTGSGSVRYFDEFIGDESRTCIDLEFYVQPIRDYVKKKILFKIREAVNFFKAEGLADFSIPYQSLSTGERMELLHGIPHLSFTKKNGRADAISDQITWPGLIALLESYSSSMPQVLNSLIQENARMVNCYCCDGTGYAKELSGYLINGFPIYRCDPTEP